MNERFYPFERRSRPRFRIEGATVELTSADSEAGASKGPRTADVVDLSVCGLSFSLVDAIPLGARLAFVLHIPDHEPMQLVGRIKWRGRGPSAPGYVYGVEFARYGAKPGYNSPSIEKELLVLEADVLEHQTE